MTTTETRPTIILIAGYWLGAWAWDEVVEHLKSGSSRTVAMTLPGLDENDPQRASKTLDDQARAILEIISQHDNQPVILVAHSGANAPVSLVLDQHPELVQRVVWVDSGPASPGSAFAPDFPEESESLPLPPFDVLAPQASIEGLSTEALERFRARAVAEPGPVVRQAVELTNVARRKVTTTLVCCSITSEQVMQLAHAGHVMFAEVATLENLDLIDLPTGHWPMWSRPADLAAIIQSASSEVS